MQLIDEPVELDAPDLAPQEPEGLSLDQTKLRIGDSIQLQFQSGTEKLRCLATLIGYVAGQSVIVSMPVMDGRPLPMREGQNLSARFFSGMNAYAFSAVVRKATSVPYPYLHLSYPAEIRGLVVRNSPRARARIDCSASTEDGSGYKCVVWDISTEGALVAGPEKMGKLGEKLLLKLPVKVDEYERVLDLNCRICSVSISNASARELPAILYGLAFEQ